MSDHGNQQKENLRIDIVSDVVCPWCIIGYKRLEKAMEKFSDKLDVELHWQPFELNPQMPSEGENLREHVQKKYGSTPEESVSARKNLTDLGQSLGFEFDYFDDMKMYNTFQAHQLLHWAGETSDLQMALKQAYFSAFFTERRNVGDPEVLIEIAAKVGLDGDEARHVLDDKRYEAAVRQLQNQWMQSGIQGVPAVIFDMKHLVSGAQETHVFEAVLEQLFENKVEERQGT